MENHTIIIQKEENLTEFRYYFKHPRLSIASRINVIQESTKQRFVLVDGYKDIPIKTENEGISIAKKIILNDIKELESFLSELKLKISAYPDS
jgi:hypothetical protein